jgi:SAM-dependent methyltransferase
MGPKDIVRRGYDALSYLYRGDTEEPEHYATWLTQLRERVPAGGTILDLGCGCGVPLARDLAASGYEVTGVDLSEVQVERARQLVPVPSHRTWPGGTPLTCGGPDSLRRRPAGCLTEVGP